MPIIELAQGSPEWLEYRKSKIMATDTPIILGSNPWKTKLELWEEKLGFREPPEMNDAMREGQLKEPLARKLSIEKLGLNFTPIVYESDEDSWMASSLDGISNCGEYILELKCPSKRKLYDQACEGFIPEYYEDQIQHQLTSNKIVKLVIYGVYFIDNNKEYITFLERKPNYEKHKSIKNLGYKFYHENMQTMNPPTEWKFKPREK